MIRVSVGSHNPVKIKAVQKAFSKAFGKCYFVSVLASSGISEMPMSFEELVDGAKNRAKESIKNTKSDFGVGLEGGFETTKLGTFLTGFVAILDKEGEWGFGRCGGILVPEFIVKRVKQGKELGEVVDEIRKTKDTRKREGTVGFLTNNLIVREQSFEHAVICALAPFINKDLYQRR